MITTDVELQDQLEDHKSMQREGLLSSSSSNIPPEKHQAMYVHLLFKNCKVQDVRSVHNKKIFQKK